MFCNQLSRNIWWHPFCNCDRETDSRGIRRCQVAVGCFLERIMQNYGCFRRRSPGLLSRLTNPLKWCPKSDFQIQHYSPVPHFVFNLVKNLVKVVQKFIFSRLYCAYRHTSSIRFFTLERISIVLSLSSTTSAGERGPISIRLFTSVFNWSTYILMLPCQAMFFHLLNQFYHNMNQWLGF